MEILLSVIVPVYQTEQYLRACLDSLLVGGDDGMEVILVNDGSTDGSLSICREYESRYEAVRCIDKVNEGVSVARNTGIAAARGKYVTFLDSDDMLCQGFLDIFFSHVAKEDSDVIFSEYEDISGDESQASLGFSHRRQLFSDSNGVCVPMSGRELLSRIGATRIHLNSCWAGFYRRELLEQHAIRFDTELNSSEDTDFVTKCIFHGERISFAEGVSVRYRRLRAGAVTAKVSENKLLNDLSVRKKWWQQLREDENCRAFFANEYSFFLKEYIARGCNTKDMRFVTLVQDSRDILRDTTTRLGMLLRLLLGWGGNLGIAAAQAILR